MISLKLDDKYLATRGRVYVTGPQVLVRLPLDQARRDAAHGLKTAGFISGYRGSPLGTYDIALWQAEKHLKANNIHFVPGVNEDLAATAVWGSQQTQLMGGARQEGVFALWYGKGPGVDRSADALKHGNYAGSSENGGVLVLCGDDHAARSSTLAHQSDHVLIHCGMPILNPANTQEYLDLGLMGFAMSRYSGCWIGFKCITDIVDASGPILVDQDRLNVALPSDYAPPPGGLSIRSEVAALRAEARLFEQRLLAAQAFARANRLDRQLLGAPGRNRLGIVSTGKSWRDVSEALARLGIGPAEAARLRISAYKVAMVWPLEPEGIKAFAAGCDELLIIEEKRGVIEEQIGHLLYNLPAERRPRIIGKRDAQGRAFISEVGELDPVRAMLAIAERYLELEHSSEMHGRLAKALELSVGGEKAAPLVARSAAFCAGCPHNTSTRVPEGSIAVAGIGCHGMAVLMPERDTMSSAQMGGEGATWIGQAPFVDRPHIFQNIGDGTYFHSGLLAIRACVAANVNITYKILLNGAVGMTGGQPIEGEQFSGEITAPRIAQQVFSEGVGRIAVVTDDVGKFDAVRAEFPGVTTFHHRDDLDAVQREIRDWKGVSALIYDQSCATERRRLRKRGKLPDTNQRLFINPQVCEGCGDCGVQSNCIAIEPLETDFGRKRQINQQACNKDYSCVKGFCPSFVTVIGGRPRLGRPVEKLNAALSEALDEPTPAVIGGGYSVLVTGIGGSGVVTIGAILGTAAHLESRACTVLDMSGFAQRNGSVMSHVRFLPDYEALRSARIPVGAADLVLGCDPIVAASPDSIAMMAPQRAVAVINHFVAPTNAFALDPNFRVDVSMLERSITQKIGADRLFGIDASGVVVALLGDAIGVNMFLVGYAWQRGLIPLARASIETAIRLNDAAVDMNLRAFALGRLASARPSSLAVLMAGIQPASIEDAEDLAALVEHRKAHLEGYQDPALAARYGALVARADSAEKALGLRHNGLALAVARVYSKLLSYKDEYEVARLLTQDVFRRQLDAAFTGDIKLKLNLSPPFLSRRDPVTGRLRKKEFGAWLLPVLAVVARLRRLRGTVFDIFGYSAHRRMERALIREYETLIEDILGRLCSANHSAAVALARCHESLRGYDVIKETSISEMRPRLEAARDAFEHASTGSTRSQPKARPLPAASIRG
jgi:indolepyruvate ferredoxin oxidoreductase